MPVTLKGVRPDVLRDKTDAGHPGGQTFVDRQFQNILKLSFGILFAQEPGLDRHLFKALGVVDGLEVFGRSDHLHAFQAVSGIELHRGFDFRARKRTHPGDIDSVNRDVQCRFGGGCFRNGQKN